MDIDLIFKIAGTGIIVAVLNLVLKRAEREEQAMLTTLAGLIVCEAVGEGLHRLGAGVETNVLGERGKLDQIAAVPEGGHAPGDLLLGLRNGGMNGFAERAQERPDVLRLIQYVFRNGLRGLSAIMALIGVAEGSAAFGAVPHGFHLPFSFSTLCQ